MRAWVNTAQETFVVDESLRHGKLQRRDTLFPSSFRAHLDKRTRHMQDSLPLK